MNNHLNELLLSMMLGNKSNFGLLPQEKQIGINKYQEQNINKLYEIANALTLRDHINRLSIQGGGGFDNGLLSGGGLLNYKLPLENNSFIDFGIGGGGAIGNVSTPVGKQKVREFLPFLNINYNKSF